MKNLSKDYKNWLYENDNEKRPLNKQIYKKYFDEGQNAFQKQLDPRNENNPYDTPDLFYKGYPWFDGYRYASENYFNIKYSLKEMQNSIKIIVKNHGLKIKYTDEYHSPYAETPEGYIIELA